MWDSGGLCVFFYGGGGYRGWEEKTPWSMEFELCSLPCRNFKQTSTYVFMFHILCFGVMRVHNLCNGGVGHQGIPNITVVLVIICCLIKKPRLHFFALLSKAAKKLRLSQAQA